MVWQVLRAILAQNPNVPPSAVQDVAVGTVLSELGGSKAARMALNHVGYPSSTSLYTVNRACASSLQAITAISDSIAVGRIDVGIGAGMESMTRHYHTKAIPKSLWPELKKSEVKEARDCIMPMGKTSDIVAERYGINRGHQDAFAANTHIRASRARRKGLFDKEIVPVSVTIPSGNSDSNSNNNNDNDSNNNDSAPTHPPSPIIQVTQDSGIHENAASTSYNHLADLKPVFSETGTTTAATSCQISDGAAAALLMRRSTAESLGVSASIIGKCAGSAVVGVAPDEMGVGPAYAIPALLSSLELTQQDVDVWEINEAFASQVLYCLRKLKLEEAWEEGRVNPVGGAIALGHPLGATGARMVSTILHQMGTRGLGNVGVVSMCVGTGMGMASLIVKE